ncbi:galactokinase [bacterium]|nr:galactokinase [bacterium]
MKENIELLFKNNFGKKNDFMSVTTPGRVNIIGGHIDYQGGKVMPLAVNRYIFTYGRKRQDLKIKIFSYNYNQFFETSLNKIVFQQENLWVNYLLGVIYEFQKLGLINSGIEIVFGGNIPLGIGLSSSAAVEISVASLLQKLFKTDIPPLDIIKLSQRAENLFVGVKCGIMDQFSVYLAKKDSAIMINCKTLDYQYVPLVLKDCQFVLVNTRKERSLASSVYNERVESANKTLEIVKRFEKVDWLTDLTPKQFKKYINDIPELLYRRALHIVEENDRVTTSVKLLNENKIDEFGNLMFRSHNSLKELYQVSCEQLDFIVDFSEKFEGIKGARLSGAGMGGCCIALIQKEAYKTFKELLTKDYSKKFGITPEFFIVKPVDGTFFR